MSASTSGRPRAESTTARRAEHTVVAAVAAAAARALIVFCPRARPPPPPTPRADRATHRPRPCLRAPFCMNYIIFRKPPPAAGEQCNAARDFLRARSLLLDPSTFCHPCFSSYTNYVNKLDMILCYRNIHTGIASKVDG